MEVDSISPQAKATVQQGQTLDLIVGIVPELQDDQLQSICQCLRTAPGNPRVLILRQQTTAASQTGPLRPPDENSGVTVVPWYLATAQAGSPVGRASAAYQSAFAAARELDARGCCVVASQFEDPTAKWICQIAEPLLDAGFDLVAPRYAPHKFEGLLNSSIIGPFNRSLYGKRLENPMGPDLGLSQRMVRQILDFNSDVDVASGIELLASVGPASCSADFQVCQAYLGSRVNPPLDWTNLSSVLADILGPIFLAMQREPARWQRVRNSVPVETVNRPVPVAQITNTVEVGRLVSSFQLGARDLQEIWGLVLPPATLFELRKISRLSPEQFQMPDELWAKIVYDFALAHRLENLNRDHLLRSLTPLYLGWVASYAREVESADTAGVHQRLERLAQAYENCKPYLISRWRWPDRFNP